MDSNRQIDMYKILIIDIIIYEDVEIKKKYYNTNHTDAPWQPGQFVCYRFLSVHWTGPPGSCRNYCDVG